MDSITGSELASQVQYLWLADFILIQVGLFVFNALKPSFYTILSLSHGILLKHFRFYQSIVLL
jgi:hypothetical protein